MNIPAVCAGMLVTPGDVIVADDDGIGLRDGCPGGYRRWKPRKARRALAMAKARKLASGVLGLDMYKMREPLERRACDYID